MIINKPKNGDYRIKRNFALFPVSIDERHDAWLQNVYLVQLRKEGLWTTVKTCATKQDADSNERRIRESKDTATHRERKWM
jgi:hypothetical protein